MINWFNSCTTAANTNLSHTERRSTRLMQSNRATAILSIPIFLSNLSDIHLFIWIQHLSVYCLLPIDIMAVAKYSQNALYRCTVMEIDTMESGAMMRGWVGWSTVNTALHWHNNYQCYRSLTWYDLHSTMWVWFFIKYHYWQSYAMSTNDAHSAVLFWREWLCLTLLAVTLLLSHTPITLQHGQGTMTYCCPADNGVQEKYEGDWAEGRMHGRGSYWYVLCSHVSAALHWT